MFSFIAAGAPATQKRKGVLSLAIQGGRSGEWESPIEAAIG